jgi:hypothetical protein
MLLSVTASVAVAQKPPMLVGTWNVTSTPTGDFNAPAAMRAGESAYIWIVSSSANGEIYVSVQGETTFPKLQGRWAPDGKSLVLEGSAKAKAFGVKKACWFRLVYEKGGTLHGIRRYLDSTPSFADFEIVAKKS